MKQNRKIVTSIASASVILTLLGFLSKGIGFIREIIYANNFGLSSEFDLYLVSVALPYVINTSIVYLTQHFFIPSYNRINSYSESDGINFFNYTFWWFFVGGVILALILYLFSGFILSKFLTSLSVEKLQFAIKIFNIFLITIPLNSGMSIIIAFLQAKFNFAYPAISLILLNIIIIILVLIFSNLLSILILPISFVIAYLISFIFLILVVKENFKWLSKEVFKVKYRIAELKIIVTLILIEVSSLSYVLIDRYFISELSEGGIAALNYAFIIFSLPISLFTIPLITTLFSKFASSPETLKIDIKNSYGMLFFIMVPFIFLFYLGGDMFLSLFYERGKFTSSDTALTYSILKNFSIGLIFISTYQLTVKIFYSLNKYFLVLAISVSAIFLKYFMNIWLVEFFKEKGLALSTTFVYLFLFVSAIILIVIKYDFLDIKHFLLKLLFYLTSALIALLVSLILFSFDLKDDYYMLLSLVISFTGIYLLNIFFTKNQEFLSIDFLLKKKLFY